MKTKTSGNAVERRKRRIARKDRGLDFTRQTKVIQALSVQCPGLSGVAVNVLDRLDTSHEP